MKSIVLIHLLAGLMYIGGLIWTIFEVIFYLADKDPINWWSVGLLGAGITIAIINAARAFFKIK